MIFRVTLSNPTLGTFVLTKEPKGLSEIAPTTKRGENHGLTTEIDVKLEFYCNGAGKEYVDSARELGIDEEVTINIEAFCGCDGTVDAPDYSIDYSDDYGSFIGGACDEDFDDFYLGLLDLKTWTTDDIFTKVNINPAGILQTVKNRLDTKVDLFADETLDGTSLDPFTFGGYDLNLHSKEIIYQSEFNFLEDEDTYYQGVTGWTLEGTDTSAVVVEFDISETEIIEERSYSQTLIPEIEVLSEVASYTGDSSSLTSNGTYPATNAQIQSTSLIIAANAGSDTYNISGHIKFAFNLYIVIGTTSSSGSKYFNYDITPKLYLQTGSTITLLETKATTSGTANFDPADSGINQLIVPLTEMTFEFDQPNITIADEGVIRVYIKFDDHFEIERPGVLGEYELFVTKQCFVNENYSIYENSYINVSQESLTPATTAKAFAIFEAGAQISRVITDQLDSFRSSFFGRTDSEPFDYGSNGCGSFRAITNGFMIRGFPTTGANARSIRMSMNDYFRGLNAIDNLGMAIVKTGDDYFITIEEKDFFYDSSTVMLQFDNVPDLKRSEAPEYYYARISVGYEKWETEFTNGLDEPNSKRQYDTGIKAVDNELQIISSLVTSAYRLEAARRKQYVNDFSEDSEYDEDNYLICLNRSTTYDVPTDLDTAEKDENFEAVNGVNNLTSPETSYNLRLSPARNLLRHSNIINAGLTKYAGREIKFMSGEGNYKMTSEMDGDACPGRWNNNLFGEGENIQWDDADNTDSTPIWIPEILEFGYPVTYTQYKAIIADPYGVFEVSETDADHIKGYILDFKYKPGDVSEFKLLRAYV